MRFSRHSNNSLLAQSSAVILAGSFPDIQRAPAGTVISPSSELRPRLAAADCEDEMRSRLSVGRLSVLVRRRPFYAAAGTVGIAALLALLLMPLRARLNDPLQLLQGDHRTFEARVAALAYAPLRQTRGATPGSHGRAASDGVIFDLQTRVEEDRSPENLQRLAIAELAIGQPARALALVEEAHRARPDDASILSDLAAAELAAGHVADAAEHSAMALENDPARTEAAFTWAAAMEKFSNRPAAIQAWQRYLTMDATGPWADEARQRLASLEEPRLTWAEERGLLVAGADDATIERLVAKYPYHARLRILNVLLPNWATSGDARVYALAHAMASKRAASDPYLLEAVEHAGRARNAVIPAIVQFRAGLDAYDSGEFDRAASLFVEAAGIYKSAGSPLWIVSAIYAASTEAYAGRPADALARIEVVEEWLAASGDRYPSMICDAVWLRGLLQARSGFPALALNAFRRAAAAAHRSGEIEQETAAQELVAAILEINGNPREAEEARIAALRSSDSISADRSRMFGTYADTAYAALGAGRPRVARAFTYSQMFVAEQEYDALLRSADQEKEPSRRDRIHANAREIRDRWGAESDARRALALLEIGRIDAAAQAIASARARAMAIMSPGYRDRVIADVDFATGLIEQRHGHARDAIAAFTSAIVGWERQTWRLHTAAGHLARAEAQRTAGDLRAAESDYRAGIEDMEAQRNGLEPELRVAYFERADRLFDRLIELLLEEGHDAEALTIAERRRARVLLDQVAAGDAAIPLDAEHIRGSMRSGEALVEITLLEKSAEIWLIYDGRIAHVRSPASRRTIEDAVARHLAAIDRGDEATVRREGRWFYDQLLGPLVSGLPPDTTLAIVADGALYALPFATLVTPDNRYLVEQFALSTVPSASVFLRPTPPRASESLLAVAQPQPGDMERLPGAAAEARNVAKHHSRGRYAVGTAIGPGEFLASAGSVASVHFAGHAKTDVDHPSQSALLFESVEGPAEELTAAQIAARRLPSAPLVILAACSTGRGKLRRNEGIQSLSAAFLQAGARGVVATLWDVDDAQSAKLFRSFHQQLREGARPIDALRSAQRVLLHSSDPRDRSPSLWASVVVEGTR
jgi:CHAT domain-containing protein